MRFGKTVAAAVAAAMVSVLFVMPVSAHHGRGHHRQAVQPVQPVQTTQTAAVDTCYPVCAVEGCAEIGRHIHDDVYYCSYAHESGYCDGTCWAAYNQTYSGYGCGGYHHGNTAVDTCYPVCAVEGCAEIGRHIHDGGYYCSYAHEGGYCDGTCWAAFDQAYSGHGCGRGHHYY